MQKYLIKYVRNFYFTLGFLFIVWMLFFDSNDFLNQYRLAKKLSDLENEKAYYLERIQEVKNDRQEILGNGDKLEKYAREHYFMKKKGEDVFIYEFN